MDCITDPRIEQIAFMKSARVGYTKALINAAIGYHVDHDPCSIMLIQPTDDDAKEYSKEEIEPMIRDCPAVGSRFLTSAKKPDSLLHKRFRGGLLHLVGARSPANFRRVSRRLILGDEIDGYPPSAGNEGDPMKLAARRSEYFWNRKLVWGSTPTYAGTSNIEREFLKGDQRRYYVPCPHCGEMQILVFQNMRWDDRPPAEAVFVCIECGAEIDHAHKRDMVAAGEWRPGPHAQFPDIDFAPQPGYVSFHIWAAYSYAPNATWGQIATEFVEASRAGPDQLKTVVNTVLGETWKDKGEAPDWQRLYERRESYALGTCPDGVLFLTAAVDVQKDRLVFEVVGWGRGKESWSIDAGVIPGDTSDLTAKGPWVKVDELLDRPFRHESGAELTIRMLAVDSSDQTQTVYNWVRTKDSTRVMAVKGNDSVHALVGTPSKVDVSKAGKPVGRLLLWRVGGPVAKSELYGWLKLTLPTDEARDAGAVTPPGYCHFPEHGEDYFKQLTAEQLVPHKSPKGFTLHAWELIPGRENHILDCRVYNRAAAFVVGLDRSKESDWQALERSLGLTPEPPDAPPPVSTPPATSPNIARRKERWVQPRRGGWLKGGR